MTEVVVRSLHYAAKIEALEDQPDECARLEQALQVGQQGVLLNLALNARDAMHQRGGLRIEAYAMGEQIVVAMTDTGEEMTAEVLAHACEPFFSTKGAKSSGLGLSMVQGFSRQSGATCASKARQSRAPGLKYGCPRRCAPSSTHQPSEQKRCMGKVEFYLKMMMRVWA